MVSSAENIELSQQVNSTGLSTRLPFGFAKRFGVLIEGTQENVQLLHKEGVSASVIMEVQRFLAAPFRMQAISNDEFERRLGMAYQSDSSDAMEMVRSEERRVGKECR